MMDPLKLQAFECVSVFLAHLLAFVTYVTSIEEQSFINFSSTRLLS